MEESIGVLRTGDVLIGSINNSGNTSKCSRLAYLSSSKDSEHESFVLCLRVMCFQVSKRNFLNKNMFLKWYMTIGVKDCYFM